MRIETPKITTNIDLLQLRNDRSLTLDAKNAIDILTLDPEFPAKIVGSFKYKVHEYPGDIDLFESYKGCCTLADTKKQIVSALKKVVRKILNSDIAHFADFKAGEDSRYKFNIGSYDMKTKRVIDYDLAFVKRKINELYADKLISLGRKKELLSLLKPFPTFKEHALLSDEIRKHYILRWTTDEILRGYKILPKDVKLTLCSAIAQKTIVKIDIWAYINERFVEVTNWFYLKSISQKGQQIVISQDMDDYQVSLQKDITQFRIPELHMHMKLAKRLWVYAVSKNDHKTMEKLYPLFSSGAAKLYQIQSEVDTLNSMLKKMTHPPMKKMLHQIEEFKLRLATVREEYMKPGVEKRIYALIDLIIMQNNTDNKKLQECLAEIGDLLHQSVDKYVKAYLKATLPDNPLSRLVMEFKNIFT